MRISDWSSAVCSSDLQRCVIGQGELAHGFLSARQMPACHMAGFMRDHADQLHRRVGLGDEAGIDEHPMTASAEGVDAGILDQMHMHSRVQADSHAPDRGRNERNRGVKGKGESVCVYLCGYMLYKKKI